MKKNKYKPKEIYTSSLLPFTQEQEFFGNPKISPNEYYSFNQKRVDDAINDGKLNKKKPIIQDIIPLCPELIKVNEIQ